MGGVVDLDGFDPFDPVVQQHPEPYYAAMRRDRPVYRVGQAQLYVVTRYADIVEAVRDPQTFSSRFGSPSTALGVGDDRLRERYRAVVAEGWETPPTLLTNDPPDHTRFRRLVGRAFTPRRVASWRPVIESIAATLVDGFADRGDCELVPEFAVPLPVRVITAALGVPDDRHADVKRWSDDATVAIGAAISDERRLEAARGIVEFQHYFADQIERRRRDPGDDLLSVLVHARVEGDDAAGLDDTRPLDLPELLGIVQQLLVAGNETTSKLICDTVRILCQKPGLVDGVRAEPDVVPNLVEEALRIAAPTQGMYRLVTRDTTLGGVPIPQGAMVVLMYASANRDETQFVDPDRVDPDRDNARSHLSFGSGIHFCVGASLARAEVEIAVQVLCDRLPTMRLADDNDLEYEPSFILRGLQRLHVRWEVPAS